MLTIKFDQLGLAPGDRVLDVGAGFGRHVFECARRGADVVALDYAEDEVVQTFYLSNADPKEMIDLLRMVIDMRRIAPILGTNAVSVRDSAERVQAAGRIIAAVDKARPEVVVDVELLEVKK